MQPVRLLVLVLVTVLVSAATPATARPIRPSGELSPPAAGTRILIVAPHIDDEALGAGGFAADAVRRGAEVYVVYLTSGDHSRSAVIANRLTDFATAPLNHKGTRRMKEAIAAGERATIPRSHLFFLGYPDRGLQGMLNHPDRTLRSAATGYRAVSYPEAVSPGAAYRIGNLVADLQTVIASVSPDVIIAPVVNDDHPDHHIAALLVGQLVNELTSAPLSLGYLIHRWPRIERFVAGHAEALTPSRDWLGFDLDPQIRREKALILAAYKSQQRSPYLRHVFAVHNRSMELFVHVSGPLGCNETEQPGL